MTLTGCGRERGGGGRKGETEYWESGNHLNEMSDLSGLLSRAQDGLGSLTLPTDRDHIVKPVGLSYFPFSITRSQTPSLGPTWSIRKTRDTFHSNIKIKKMHIYQVSDYRLQLSSYKSGGWYRQPPGLILKLSVELIVTLPCVVNQGSAVHKRLSE